MCYYIGWYKFEKKFSIYNFQKNFEKKFLYNFKSLFFNDFTLFYIFSFNILLVKLKIILSH